MKREIKKQNNPVLRQPTQKVENFDIELQTLIDDMIETMRAEKGVGLAAPQVGESKKILVCEFGGDKEENIQSFPLTVICNPEITRQSEEKCNMVEGCLSFPGLEILIKRPKEITIKGQDRYGKDIEITAKELFGRVLQHENDHLNSTLLIDHIQETSIIFIGTGTLGVPALEALAVDPQYKIKMVITSDFEVTSRNKKEFNPIADIAKKYNLEIVKVKNINDPKVLTKIRTEKPELIVMADFGQIIKKEVLEIAPKGIVNIHPSLLPKHRGPSPVQQTILDGDKTTGVSLLMTDERMDAGGIISQAKMKLSGTETTTILKDYLARVGASLLLNSLPYYLAGDLEPIQQNDQEATFSRLFKKEDGLVDKKTSPIEIDRKIRAFDQWPKVYTIVKGKRIQILASHFDADSNLCIDRVKPEGKNEMTYDDFIRGYHTKLTFGA